MKARSFTSTILVLLALGLLFPVAAIATGQQGTETKQASPTAASVKFPAIKDLLDPAIPKSWYDAPKSASQMGIKKFSDSPMLADKVRSGALPPVEKRLPDNPMVIEPYKEVGKYGGTLRVMNRNGLGPIVGDILADKWGDMLFHAAPDSSKAYPWIVESYEYRNNANEIVLHFRKGTKWSDGVPFLAGKEFVFLWKYILTDKKISTVDPLNYDVNNITAEDDNTVVLHFTKPRPNYHEDRLTGLMPFTDLPGIPAEHVMKDYIPAIVGEAKALASAKALGFDTVQAAVTILLGESVTLRQPKYRIPTLKPYICVESTETRYVFERNPYYWAVDTAGNQLPYIDRIVSEMAASREIAEAKATSGELDIENLNLLPQNIPLYKRNEAAGKYRTLIYTDGSTTKPFYTVNWFTKDPDKNKVFMEADFRRALSLAINRKEVNDKIFFGLGVPIQNTIPFISKYFRQEYATSYTDYDPTRAKKLLDGIGVVDTNKDGFRELPGGKKFTFQLMIAEAEYLGPVALHELVISYWRAIGLDVSIDLVDGAMLWKRSGTVVDFDLRPHVNDTPYPTIRNATAMGFTFAPMPTVWGINPWAKYALWIATSGKEGVEPPDSMKKLNADANTFLLSEDEPALRRLLQAQADNLWTIGVVGYQPVPEIVSNRLKNVPEKMIHVAGLRKWQVSLPVQYYLDE